MSKKQMLDVAERVLWTAAEAIVAVLAVHTADLDPMWIPVATAMLAAAKSVIAQHVGDSSSALPLWATEAIQEETESAIEFILDKKVAKRIKQ